MPRARRFLPLMITMVMLIFYHALISAVSLNVQPRYALVINPFRAVMIVLAGYLALMFATTVIRAVGRVVSGSAETISE